MSAGLCGAIDRRKDMMSENEFKARANNLTEANEIDHLCFAWLRDASKEQAPKVRDMMLAALDVLRRGVE